MKPVASRENRRSVALLGFMVLAWWGIFGPASYISWQRGTDTVPAWVLAMLGVCDLIGLLLLWSVLQQAYEWLRYGDVAAEIAAPASLGGRLSARLRLPPSARGANSVSAEFACIHLRWRKKFDRSGSNEIRDDRHREAREFPIAWSGSEGRADIAFAVPPGLPPSDLDRDEEEDDEASRARGYHYWELKIHVPGPGGGIRRSYPVRVEAKTPQE